MKVLHVLTTNEYSGAENVACQIFGMFSDNPEYGMIYCSPEGKIREVLQRRGINYLPIKAFTPAEIKKAINETKPDIIHAHDRKAGVVCALLKGNARLILHMHNNPDGAKKLSAESIGYALACKKAEHIIWVSQEAYDYYYFKKTFAEKSVVLKNFISPDKVNRLADEDTQNYGYDVIFVGRMMYQKNPERFVEIIKILTEEFPDIRTAIVGSGELEDDVKKYINNLKMDHNIDFLGYKENPYGLIKSSKVLLLPSRWEGLPMVQLEAEALGTHVVRTPGTNEELADRVKQCMMSADPAPIKTDFYEDYKRRLNEIYAG